MIFHEKYTGQFIWKKADSRNNIEQQSTPDEQSSADNTETADKSYIEKVNVTFKIVWKTKSTNLGDFD